MLKRQNSVNHSQASTGTVRKEHIRHLAITRQIAEFSVNWSNIQVTFFCAKVIAAGELYMVP